jgi:transposase
MRRKKTGPNPTDRAKLGSKHHVLTDARGIPLVVRLTGANAHDVTELIPLIDAVPAVAGKVGHPKSKPEMIQADRGYDSQPHRNKLRDRNIEPLIAKRGQPHGSGLGKTRWVVERTISWLHQFRRLRIRFEKRSDIHEAFLAIGCTLICLRFC